ncbi:hypothetical protein WS69_14365 [Burkholderia sp. BDU5]|nr:hypothetical protein WS69_14365 [Burkholderia sp. BDU5]
MSGARATGAACGAPHPSAARFHSVVTHAIFGIGLYGTGSARLRCSAWVGATEQPFVLPLPALLENP